jgi:uncharacterized membrane protein YkvA (DUF1232 family)
MKDLQNFKKPLPRYIITESIIHKDTNKILFFDLLTKNIELYEGPNKELQEYCPQFFGLLSNILNDKFVDWHTKIMISAAMGYFVLDCDIIPDTQENGYIDDLYLITYVLNEIKNSQTPEIIIRNWNEDTDIIQLIDEVFEATSSILGNLSKPILQKVGLYKFSQLPMEEYSGKYPKRLAKVANDKRELLGLLAYIIQKVENEYPSNRSYEKIKKYVENNGNFDEIQRIIELSKLYHQIEIESKNNGDGKEIEKDLIQLLERRMREVRLQAIMENK